jgi:L-lactate dehydrogenase (cytochrome)
MKPITNIEDLRRIAMRRCPRLMFDYIEAGSYDEITRDANRAELRALRFRQKVLIDTTGRSMATTLLGQQLAMPVVIAPNSLAGLMWGDGEILAARAAEAAGTAYTLSTMSICSIEDVRGAVKKPIWFQLYVFRDRGFSEAMIARAQAAACPVLMVTVDLPQPAQRHADRRNGITLRPRLRLRSLWDVASKPAWIVRVLRGRRKTFGNIDGYLKARNIDMHAVKWLRNQIDASLNWRDIEWIRKLWTGKLVLKGILDVADARNAVAAGADGIVVSNHGGCQLDGAPATISVLPEIAAAVGDRTEILFDGGIRSGQDVIKALALGARGCLIGRAHLYGLAAMGEAGVAAALAIIREEMEITMMLTGTRDTAAIVADILYRSSDAA